MIGENEKKSDIITHLNYNTSSEVFEIPESLKKRLYPVLCMILKLDILTKLKVWSGYGKCTTISMEVLFWQMIWVWERQFKFVPICNVFTIWDS